MTLRIACTESVQLPYTTGSNMAKFAADVKPAPWYLIQVPKLDKLDDKVQSYEHAMSNKFDNQKAMYPAVSYLSAKLARKHNGTAQ